jgi:ATP-dependent RNA helicase HelY
MRAHPCHACNDREEHARISERADRLEREIIDLQKRVENRTHVIPRTFDQICSVLSELNYIDGENIAPEGEMLSSIYSEFDLLVSESIRQKIWNELTPAELASVLSAIIFQARNDDEAKMKTPKGAILEATKSMERIWFAIHTLESINRLDTMRQLDTGLTWATYRWASGATLSEVLENTDLTAGDFVRQMKQLLDLLTQISALSNPLSFAASEATKLLKRGVIAYSNQVA